MEPTYAELRARLDHIVELLDRVAEAVAETEAAEDDRANYGAEGTAP